MHGEVSAGGDNPPSRHQPHAAAASKLSLGMHSQPRASTVRFPVRHYVLRLAVGPQNSMSMKRRALRRSRSQ
jgi:hypothetical protein